jgi:hypothetical protein
MGRGATEGGAWSGHGVGRWVEDVAEVLRERRSERRARTAARLGVTPRLPRSTLAAAVDARLAVRAGVRLDDFLRHRLARYAGKLPVTLDALPATVDVEAGEVVVRARPRPRALAPRPEHGAAQGGGTAKVGGWPARDLRDAEGALDTLDARAAEARARADALERDLAAALASGAIVARPALDVTAEQLGRPAVPAAAPIHALRAFVGLLLAAEAWRFSGPILAGAGIAAGDRGVEAALRVAPVVTGLALLFAVGGAAAAFTFAWLALARGADAVAAGVDGGRRPLLLAASAATAALVPAVAAAASTPDRWAQLGLVAAVPFGAAALVRAAAALASRRDVALALALAWDRERAREALERGRREEVWLRAAEELRSLEVERGDARRRLARLHRDAVAAERAGELAARAEADRLERLCESLACALELDRYLYVRFAAERAGAGLDRPRARVVDAPVSTERLGVAS